MAHIVRMSNVAGPQSRYWQIITVDTRQASALTRFVSWLFWGEVPLTHGQSARFETTVCHRFYPQQVIQHQTYATKAEAVQGHAALAQTCRDGYLAVGHTLVTV